VPVITDVHEPDECAAAAEVADALQIPAFLCRQTALLVAAARTGRAVNVKKGQFLAPWDTENIVEKVRSVGNEQVLLTERGASFGYNNLVADMRSLVVMRSFDVPVVFDATHSVQLPGGAGTASAGQREFVPYLARAAVATGCDALFMEIHPDPDQAPSDGPNMLRLEDLPALLAQVTQIDRIVRGA
jgi:2-dehydro-3-deoxyphosphooctonate aldolase (KDO 8-P synthase)